MECSVTLSKVSLPSQQISYGSNVDIFEDLTSRKLLNNTFCALDLMPKGDFFLSEHRCQ